MKNRAFFITLVNTIRQHKTNKLQSCSKNPHSDCKVSHMVITASCSMLLSKCMEEMYARHVTRARALFPFIDSKLAAPSRPICHVLVHILSLLGRPKPKTLNASQISLNLS